MALVLKQQSEHFRTACETTQKVFILQFVKTLSADEDACRSNDAADQKHGVHFQTDHLTQLTQAALRTAFTEIGFYAIDLQCEKNSRRIRSRRIEERWVVQPAPLRRCGSDKN